MSIKEKVDKETQRIEEDTNFSSTEHFIASAIWSKVHFALGIPTVVLAVISGSSALTTFDSHTAVAGILAIVTAVLAGISTFLNPNQRANYHLNAGNEYRKLRNEARIFREIDLAKSSDEEASEQIKKLSSRRDALNESSPQPPDWAYKAALKAIEKDKSTVYAVDK